jgi:hypothetical protein
MDEPNITAIAFSIRKASVAPSKTGNGLCFEASVMQTS